MKRRRWRLLLNLIDHLPAASYFAEAMANDEEMAREYLAAHGEQEPKPPRVAGWTEERAELVNMVDRLAEIVVALIAVNGGKPPQFQPRPRPVTALDRVRQDARRDRHLALVQRLLPDRGVPLPE